MNEWRPFDVKAFLKASKRWDEDIKKLRQQHDDLPLLPSMGDKTTGKSGNVSDVTGRLALRRLEIKAKIEKLELYKEMLAYVLKTLTEDERLLVNGFFFPKKEIGVFVQEYGIEHGLCKDYVYAERDKVLKKMSDTLLREYYGEEE